jgi:SAM-dependent methyltransferase
MDTAYEARYHALEATQWWCVARREIVSALLRGRDRGSRILEIGCSSGLFLTELKREGFPNVVGCDVSGLAAREAKRRGEARVAAMDAAHLAIAAEQFDIVVASDVLEHLRDDGAALAEWHRVLHPSGVLVIFVPAFMSLWGEHDALNQHYRRYRRAQLADLLRRAGFTVVRDSYWNVALFFPAVAVRFLQRWLPGAGSRQLERMEPIPRLLNALLLNWLRLENLWLARFGLAPGMSAFAVARKR